VADTSGAVDQEPGPASTRQRAAGGDVATKHRVDGGARLQLGPDGERYYSVSCSCGWLSEMCGTAVLAEAHGEQHATFAQGRSRPGRPQ